MRLPRPLPMYDVNSDWFPNDDYWIEKWKTSILNRMDREWGCDAIVDMSEPGLFGFPIYCGVPEWDPFTNRCWDHTTGNI